MNCVMFTSGARFQPIRTTFLSGTINQWTGYRTESFSHIYMGTSLENPEMWEIPLILSKGDLTWHILHWKKVQPSELRSLYCLKTTSSNYNLWTSYRNWMLQYWILCPAELSIISIYIFQTGLIKRTPAILFDQNDPASIFPISSNICHVWHDNVVPFVTWRHIHDLPTPIWVEIEKDKRSKANPNGGGSCPWELHDWLHQRWVMAAKAKPKHTCNRIKASSSKPMIHKMSQNHLCSPTGE